MHTRSQSRNLHNQQHQAPPPVVEQFNLEEPIENPDPLAPMDDTRTMAQLLEAPTAGYEDAIVVPESPRTTFEIKHGVSKEDFQAYVKANDAVMRNMQTQGQNMQNQLTNLTDMFSKFVTYNTASTSGTLLSNTVTKPKEDLKGITTRSGVAYKGPTIPITSSPKVMECETEVIKDTMPPTNNGSTEDVQPPVVPVVHHESIFEPVNAPVSASMPNQKASIPFPSRRNDERRREKANDQIEKFYEIFRDLSFEISFTDALMLMPKFASTLKTLIGNKEKLSEMARTPLNENCSAVILNKLPKKLGDPGRFLIPCEFSGINTCNALADLGASINLMPYSVWKNLSLPELTPTCMTLELADRSISEPIGIAEDVYVTVGKFQFPADFVVVDFEPDPRVPLILGRSFLKTSRALIDVYEGEITLRVGREAITFNLDQTSRYTANYNHMTANRIDVIDMACEEYSQEVLGFSNVISSGNPTPYYDPIVSTSSPTLTPFGDSDFLLFEEADSFLAIEDDPTSPEVDPTYYDPDGDILLLEAILNSDPSPPPNQGNYFPETRKDLKICEANNEKSSVNEPPEVELKDLPPHLEYAFLEGNDKLPVIIAKELRMRKSSSIEVLKSHKRATLGNSPILGFGAPRCIISDRGNHFCNDQLQGHCLNTEVTHRLSHRVSPKTSGQVESIDRGLKRILKGSRRKIVTLVGKTGCQLSGPSVQTYKTPSGALRTRLYMERHVSVRLSWSKSFTGTIKHATLIYKTAGELGQASRPKQAASWEAPHAYLSLSVV
ncbi:reverse transcriptase domain-containing protein [Tanacetum coccineum]